MRAAPFTVPGSVPGTAASVGRFAPAARRLELAALHSQFCDGLEEAGLVEYARRGRLIADELRRAQLELDAERSLRTAFQNRAERWHGIFTSRAYEAICLLSEQLRASTGVSR